MITMDDVVGLTDLTKAEIDAIAEHEALPRVNAAALAQYVLEHHRGAARVQDMICDDIRSALHRKDLGHARELYDTLRHFMAHHPEAVHGVTS